MAFLLTSGAAIRADGTDIEWDYGRLGLTQKFQGDQPVCWAYAFVNALELAVSRREGHPVRFDEVEVVALGAARNRETLGSRRRQMIAASRGDQIEPILWMIWQYGLHGSDGRVYRDIAIDLAPGVPPVMERDPRHMPFENDRLTAAIADGWAKGNRAWMLRRLAVGQPVVCTLLGWRDGERRNFMVGHAVTAVSRLSFRNSWESEPRIVLDEDEADRCLYANYTVRLCSEAERVQAQAAIRAAAERWNFLHVDDDAPVPDGATAAVHFELTAPDLRDRGGAPSR